MAFGLNATKTVSKGGIGTLVYYGELRNRRNTFFPQGGQFGG
jgi:hypothetical protein